MLSLAAAATGISTFAVRPTCSHLFADFPRREAFIVSVRERIGIPPSDVNFLDRLQSPAMLDELRGIFRETELWIAAISWRVILPILCFAMGRHHRCNT
jgi:hypothetical protein